MSFIPWCNGVCSAWSSFIITIRLFSADANLICDSSLENKAKQLGYEKYNVMCHGCSITGQEFGKRQNHVIS